MPPAASEAAPRSVPRAGRGSGLRTGRSRRRRRSRLHRGCRRATRSFPGCCAARRRAAAGSTGAAPAGSRHGEGGGEVATGLVGQPRQHVEAVAHPAALRWRRVAVAGVEVDDHDPGPAAGDNADVVGRGAPPPGQRGRIPGGDLGPVQVLERRDLAEWRDREDEEAGSSCHCRRAVQQYAMPAPMTCAQRCRYIGTLAAEGLVGAHNGSRPWCPARRRTAAGCAVRMRVALAHGWARRPATSQRLDPIGRRVLPCVMRPDVATRRLPFGRGCVVVATSQVSHQRKRGRLRFGSANVEHLGLSRPGRTLGAVLGRRLPRPLRQRLPPRREWGKGAW